VLAPIGEFQSRSGDKIAHRSGDEDLVGRGAGRHARRDVEREPGEVVAPALALPGVDPDAHRDAARRRGRNDRRPCAHGLGRWSEDCGCHTGSGGLGWTQAWRSPLRAALDGLRDELAAAYEQKGAELFFDPWAARNAYIAALLDPEPEVFSEVLRWHARRALSPSDEALARRLLEMQRFAMLMYTSCGWFFDDPSGLETTQILLYAARAIDLSDGLAPPSVESDFLDHLSRAASNDPAAGDARRIYQSAIARAKSESLSREA
jgi:hypothetical protein